MSALWGPCRSPLGLRGLKYFAYVVLQAAAGRSPLGLRGLKFGIRKQQNQRGKSQPTRTAWIEIRNPHRQFRLSLCRSPLGLRGFKYSLKFIKTLDYKSRSPLWLCELDSGMM